MNFKNKSAAILFLLVIVACPFVSLSFKIAHKPVSSLRIDKRKTKSGNNYTIFYKDNLVMDFLLKRPDKNDSEILLCIPGAFTDLKLFKVDGLYIDKGTVNNKNQINHTLGGAIKIINGECEIFPSKKGKLLNDSLINLMVKQKASLFQQIQVIEKGKGARFKDLKEFQRRAIVKIKGKTAVVESFEHITLSAFTMDLLELGVSDALYTDMGSWDEGWYKNTDAVITIGRIKTQTDKQSNWVVFKTTK